MNHMYILSVHMDLLMGPSFGCDHPTQFEMNTGTDDGLGGALHTRPCKRIS